uniref:G_PROTEIN_RECEP_F1_2 domain-containing protein n=1 Tax=Parastrongyloides trichosuri TaxID=131310 RepID=A0A0N4Z807_PARTI
MRLLFCIKISEKNTSIFGCPISNRCLCAFFGLAQFTVIVISFYQHIFSYSRFKEIFHCHSNISINATAEEKFMAYDVIIFDFGLMHRILGTDECVANYLDGGYMRAMWCLEQGTSLIIMTVNLTCLQKYVWLMWPALLMESSYALGMSILTMATAPKILEAIGGLVDKHLALSLSYYLLGFLLNWFFTLIMWHYYWHIEMEYSPPPPIQTRPRVNRRSRASMSSHVAAVLRRSSKSNILLSSVPSIKKDVKINLNDIKKEEENDIPIKYRKSKHINYYCNNIGTHV